MKNTGRPKDPSNTDLVSGHIQEVLRWSRGIFAILSL